MMKKKIAASFLAMSMAVSLAACGGGAAETTAADTTAAESGAENAESTEAGAAESNESSEAEAKEKGWWKDGLKTVAEGKLTVATSPDFAPYEFYAIGEDGTPELAGFDVALAHYIADYMGLELDIVPMDFDGVIMELSMGNVDLGMAGLSPDAKRESQMDFSDLYYKSSQSLVCLKENASKYDSIEKANNPEVTIGAQIGSIQADLAAANTPDANNIQLAKVTDIIAEILSGKMDMGYIETAVAESYQKTYPDLEIVLDVPYENAGSAIGVSKDNAELLAGVNEAIAEVLSDGTMEDFIAKANEQASGETYEGLLGEDGQVQEQQ